MRGKRVPVCAASCSVFFYKYLLTRWWSRRCDSDEVNSAASRVVCRFVFGNRRVFLNVQRCCDKVLRGRKLLPLAQQMSMRRTWLRCARCWTPRPDKGCLCPVLFTSCIGRRRSAGGHSKNCIVRLVRAWWRCWVCFAWMFVCVPYGSELMVFSAGGVLLCDAFILGMRCAEEFRVRTYCVYETSFQ